MFSRDWFDAIPLISFVDGDEYPQMIFFNVVDGAVFLDLWKVYVVSFCFSSWILSPDGSSFYDAGKGVVFDAIDVSGLELWSGSIGLCHDGRRLDLMLRTNGAYRATCRFWVRSLIRTSVRGFTSIDWAGLKVNVRGFSSRIETQRSYVAG